MKTALKTILPIALTASPALAHTGVHMHPHGSENWIAGALLVGTCVAVYGARRLAALRVESRK
ncbi:hypothetical protein [Cognatishimia activa]|uniref:Uncharacterized protein n=1 Tax=Cognatishimia activa TaxID=1715691 RepID=A0A0N7MBY0_9RHOB|nr:hypothetical protein [Cognatishimia activa]CUI73952.1 hypothetical protein TA5113_01309 [Cognatishimia activa]CUK26664.1 hypothetical protein TA5114_02480 [Cognatishimia activa]